MLLLAALFINYCSKFVTCTKNQKSCPYKINDCSKYNITAAKEIGKDISYSLYLYCMDYKETDELTQPGYLCNGMGALTICTSLGKKATLINRLEYNYYYCCNQKYLPFPTSTPLRTRTFMSTPVSTPQRTEIKTPDPSVIPVTKNNKNNIANLVSFFVLTSLT